MVVFSQTHGLKSNSGMVFSQHVLNCSIVADCQHVLNCSIVADSWDHTLSSHHQHISRQGLDPPFLCSGQPK